MRQSKDIVPGKILSQRTNDVADIQWVQSFKKSQDGKLKIERGFSDNLDDADLKNKRSTIAQKLANFVPENSFEGKNSGINEEEKKIENTLSD